MDEKSLHTLYAKLIWSYKWLLRDVEKPIGVSEYRLSDVLPSVEDIQSRVLGATEGENDE